MKFLFISLSLILLDGFCLKAQEAGIDTNYICSYDQKIWLQGNVSSNEIRYSVAGIDYKPNNPLNIGLGFALKNTVINANLNYGLVPLKSAAYGKTKLTDLQIHHYSQSIMVDVFFQKYKGFFDDYYSNKEIMRYPDLSVFQGGAEATYIFNGKRFSAKAAFQQSEKQIQSAGSLMLGGGAYLYKIGFDPEMRMKEAKDIQTFQAGLNVGYGYTWVLRDHWLFSGMAKVGANLGSAPQLNGSDYLKIYPTAFARASATYLQPNWAISFLMLLHTKSINAYQNEMQLTSINFQLSYVRHLDHLFKKK